MISSSMSTNNRKPPAVHIHSSHAAQLLGLASGMLAATKYCALCCVTHRFNKQWLERHIEAAAKELGGKPLVLQEYNMPACDQRTELFELVSCFKLHTVTCPAVQFSVVACAGWLQLGMYCHCSVYRHQLIVAWPSCTCVTAMQRRHVGCTKCPQPQIVTTQLLWQICLAIESSRPLDLV
jgi:hypothetical protein